MYRIGLYQYSKIHTGICQYEIFSFKNILGHESTSPVDQGCSWLLQLPSGLRESCRSAAAERRTRSNRSHFAGGAGSAGGAGGAGSAGARGVVASSPGETGSVITPPGSLNSLLNALSKSSLS
jgi:hypothetical protein